MKIFLTPDFRKKKKGLSKIVDNSLVSLITSLRSKTLDQFQEMDRVKELKGINPPIYIIDIDNYRLFTSPVDEGTADEGMLLLDLQDKSGPTQLLQYLEGEDLFWEVDAIIADTIQELADDETVSSLTANTNAWGWYVDDYNIDTGDISKNSDGSVSLRIHFHLSGDQDEDRVYHGNKINGTAIANINLEGEVEYDVESAEIEDDDTEPDY